MQFNEDHCKVLQLDRNNQLHKYTVSRNSAEKDQRLIASCKQNINSEYKYKTEHSVQDVK